MVIIQINLENLNHKGIQRNLLTCAGGLSAAEQLVVTDEKGIDL